MLLLYVCACAYCHISWIDWLEINIAIQKETKSIFSKNILSHKLQKTFCHVPQYKILRHMHTKIWIGLPKLNIFAFLRTQQKGLKCNKMYYWVYDFHEQSSMANDFNSQRRVQYRYIFPRPRIIKNNNNNNKILWCNLYQKK